YKNFVNSVKRKALSFGGDAVQPVVMPGWNWTGWLVTIVDQLFYKKSVSRIFGRFPSPARSVAFFSARSHCSDSASFRVFNAVSDTPNSRCFRHRNHVPSTNVPGSISSASALQIGHDTIANFPNVMPHTTIRLPSPGIRSSIHARAGAPRGVSMRSRYQQPGELFTSARSVEICKMMSLVMSSGNFRKASQT
ncbi:MAG: hypothetical protein WBL86_27745, partial [Pseudolabrys sp.]